MRNGTQKNIKVFRKGEEKLLKKCIEGNSIKLTSNNSTNCRLRITGKSRVYELLIRLTVNWIPVLLKKIKKKNLN